jgi:hypothetical protein
MLAARLKQGQAAGIFSPALLNGDTPRRDKWRKTLARVATILACAGLAATLAGLSGLHGKWHRPAPEAGAVRP